MSINLQKFESNNPSLLQMNHPINTLPSELLCKILAFLPPKDQALTAQVSRSWNKASITTIENDEYNLMRSFVYFVRDNLSGSDHKKTIERLNTCLENKEEFSGCISVKYVKFSTRRLKHEILTLLQGLNESDFHLIKEGCNKTEFDELLDLLNIYISIEDASKIEDANKRVSLLQKASAELTQKGYMRKALEVVEKIPEFKDRIPVFKTIYQFLKNSSSFDRDIELIKKLPYNFDRGVILENVCRKFISNNNLAKAIEIAITIPDPATKQFLLQKVEYYLKKCSKLDPSMDFAHNMLTMKNRDSAFAQAAKSLARFGQLQSAINCAKKIEDMEHRGTALASLSHFAIRGNGTTAIALAQDIQDPSIKGTALAGICLHFILEREIDRAADIANKLFSSQVIMESALDTLGKTLVQKNAFGSVAQFADQLKNSCAKGFFLRNASLTAHDQLFSQDRPRRLFFSKSKEAKPVVSHHEYGCEDIRLAALKIPDLKIRNSTLLELAINTFKADGRVRGASMSFFNSANFVGAERADALLDYAGAMLEAKQHQQALNLIVTNLQDLMYADNDKYRSLIKKVLIAYIKMDESLKAIEIANYLLAERVRNQDLISVAVDLAKNSNHEKAISFALKIPQVEVRDYALLKIADCLILLKKFDVLQNLVLEEMQFNKRNLINCISFHALDGSQSMLATIAITLANKKRFAEALEMTKLIPGSEERDQEMMNICVALAESGNIEGAGFFAHNLFGSKVSTEGKRKALDAICDAVLKSRDMDSFNAFINTVLESELQQRALFRVSMGLARQGELVAAFELFADDSRLRYVRDIAQSLDVTKCLETDPIRNIEHSSYSSSLKQSIAYCYALIHARSGDFRTVQKYVQLARSVGGDIHLGLCDYIYRECFQNCSIADSIKYAEEIKNLSIRKLAYFSIAYRAGAAGESAIALDLIHRLSQMNLTYLDGEQLSYILARIDNVQAGIDFVNNIKELNDRCYVLKEFSKSLVLNERIHDAMNVARGINNKHYKEESFDFILHHFILKGEIEKAREFFESIHPGDSDWSGLMYQNGYKLIKNLLDKDAAHKAIDLAGKTKEKSWRASYLRMISQYLAKRGKVDEAIEIARSIPDRLSRHCAIQDVCIALITKGNDIERAFATISDLLAEYEHHEFIIDTCKLLALEYQVTHALDFAYAVTDEETRNRALSKVSLVMLKSGDMDAAQRVADAIPDSTWKQLAQREIDDLEIRCQIREMLRCGDVARAKRKAAKNKRYQYLIDQFSKYIQKQKSEDRSNFASEVFHMEDATRQLQKKLGCNVF